MFTFPQQTERKPRGSIWFTLCPAWPWKHTLTHTHTLDTAAWVQNGPSCPGSVSRSELLSRSASFFIYLPVMKHLISSLPAIEVDHRLRFDLFPLVRCCFFSVPLQWISGKAKCLRLSTGDTHTQGPPAVYQLYLLTLLEPIMLKQASDVFFMISFKHLISTASCCLWLLPLASGCYICSNHWLPSSAWHPLLRFCLENVACLLCWTSRLPFVPKISIYVQ